MKGTWLIGSWLVAAGGQLPTPGLSQDLPFRGEKRFHTHPNVRIVSPPPPKPNPDAASPAFTFDYSATDFIWTLTTLFGGTDIHASQVPYFRAEPERRGAFFMAGALADGTEVKILRIMAFKGVHYFAIQDPAAPQDPQRLVWVSGYHLLRRPKAAPQP